MPESSSPPVRRREKADRSTQAALTATRDLMAEKLTSHYAPYVREGETPIDWGYLWDLLNRDVDGAKTMLVAADQENLEKKALVTERRNQKSGRTTTARDQLMNMRRTLEGGYGPDADERVGYAGPVPEETIAVLRLGNIVLGHVGDFASLGLEPLEHGSGEVDEKTVNKLRDRVTELDDSVKGLNDAVRDAEQALLRRQQALPEHDRVYNNVGRVAEGFCRLVKEDERADRMRVSFRTIARKKNEEDTPPPDGEPTAPEEAPAEPVTVP